MNSITVIQNNLISNALRGIDYWLKNVNFEYFNETCDKYFNGKNQYMVQVKRDGEINKNYWLTNMSH